MLEKIKKFKNTSPAAKASLALLCANLILKGLSLISGPIFTRIMPTAEYGIVSTFMSWQSLLTVIVTLNLTSGVFNNGMLEFREDRDCFQFSLLVVSSISAIIYFCIYLLFSKIFNQFFELPVILIYFMFAYFFFVPAYQYWSGRQRYEYKYKLLTCIIIGISLFSVVFGIVAVLQVPDDSRAVAKVFASEVVNILIGAFFFIYIGIKAKFKCKIEYCIFALKFNIPLIPHYLSMYVLSSSDRIMISKMVNASATAIYSVAYTVGMVINIVWQSIEASLAPWIYEKLGSEDYKRVKKLTVRIVLLFGVMCSICTLFAPEIMKILAPANYYSGIYVIPSISAGVFFTAVYSLYMRVELFYKKTGFATIATTLAAVANLILNYIFIQLYSFYAAGYTTLICYFLLYLLHYLNVRKKGYSHIMDNGKIFGISIVVITITILITFLYRYTILRYAMIGFVLVILLIKNEKIISYVKEIK